MSDTYVKPLVCIGSSATRGFFLHTWRLRTAKKTYQSAVAQLGSLVIDFLVHRQHSVGHAAVLLLCELSEILVLGYILSIEVRECIPYVAVGIIILCVPDEHVHHALHPMFVLPAEDVKEYIFYLSDPAFYDFIVS